MATEARIEAYSLLHGASWLSPEGQVVPVPSFHEKWLAQHPELSEGAESVFDFIRKKRWISVILMEKGSLELIISEIGAADIRLAIFTFLVQNRGLWTRATLMALDRDGYSLLFPSDIQSPEAFNKALDHCI